MDYDRIIIELMNRISILEERVERLESSNPTDAEKSEQAIQTDSSVPKSESSTAPKQYFSSSYSSTRDNTKYMFDGVRYGKNRLVLAIVKKYAAAHPDISAGKLIATFDKSLQGSLGVVRTVQDVKESYFDSERRFFLQPNEIINTTTEPCAVCTQWSAFNIKNIIARARELGMTITEI